MTVTEANNYVPLSQSTNSDQLNLQEIAYIRKKLLMQWSIQPLLLNSRFLKKRAAKCLQLTLLEQYLDNLAKLSCCAEANKSVKKLTCQN